MNGQSGDRSKQAMRRNVASVAGALNNMSMETSKKVIRKVESCMVLLIVLYSVGSRTTF